MSLSNFQRRNMSFVAQWSSLKIIYQISLLWPGPPYFSVSYLNHVHVIANVRLNFTTSSWRFKKCSCKGTSVNINVEEMKGCCFHKLTFRITKRKGKIHTYQSNHGKAEIRLQIKSRGKRLQSRYQAQTFSEDAWFKI